MYWYLKSSAKFNQLYITTADNKPMRIGEVQVFVKGENVAPLGTAKGSLSIDEYSTADVAINGCSSSWYYRSSDNCENRVFITEAGKPYLRLTLPETYSTSDLDKIVIHTQSNMPATYNLKVQLVNDQNQAVETRSGTATSSNNELDGQRRHILTL